MFNRIFRNKHLSKQLAVHIGKIGDERKQSLQYPELDIHALVHAVRHGLHDHRHGGLRYRFERNEALQRAQGYRDDLRVLRLASHEHRPQEVVGLRAICKGSVNSGPQSVRCGTHRRPSSPSPARATLSGSRATSPRPKTQRSMGEMRAAA